MGITLFQGFTDPSVTTFEKWGLIAVVGVAILGLLYAWLLTGQVLKQSPGDAKMMHLADAIQKGGNAYLSRQFRTILLIVFVLAVFIYFTGIPESPANLSQYGNPPWLIGLGRAAGFLMGAAFSCLV